MVKTRQDQDGAAPRRDALAARITQRLGMLALCLASLSARAADSDITSYDELPTPVEAISSFGYRVSVSGDTAFVGDHPNNRVHVYTQDGDGLWTHAQTISSPAANADARFGHAISLQGDRAVIGAYFANGPGQNFYDGSVYVYERQGDGSWLLDSTIVLGAGPVGACFGWSLSLDDDALLVGQIASPADAPHSPKDCAANGATAGFGAAYVFRRAGAGSWPLEDTLEPVNGDGSSDGLSDSHFGFAVALDGDYAVVTSDHHDLGLGGSLHGEGGYHSGKAYVYKHDGAGNWSLEDQLQAGDTDPGNHFGYDVSIQDDTVLIGARRVESGTDLAREFGAAYVFTRDGAGNWSQQQQIDPPDGGQDRGLFGNAVELSGDWAVIGELHDDDVPFWADLGAAHLYQRQSGGSWVHSTSAFDNPLVDPTDTPANFAGNGLGLSGRTLVAGANKAVTGGGTGRAFGYHITPFSYSWSAVLPLRPAGYWQLDETFGDTAWDISGHRRDGALRNGLTLGQTGIEEGVAASFDGVDDEIQISGAFGGLGLATISAWLNGDAAASGLQMAAGAAAEDFLAIGIDRGQNPVQIVAKAYGGATATLGADLPSEGWHHVALVFDASGGSGALTLYIDGSAAAISADVGFASLSSSDTLYIGRGPDTGSGGDHFSGRIDEVAVFHRALSAAQVQAIADAPALGSTPLTITATGPGCAPASCSEDATVSGTAVAVGARDPVFAVVAGSVSVAGQSVADDSIALNTSSGIWSYAPENREADYALAFTLRVDEGAETDTAAVNVTIAADNDAPTASQSISAATDDVTAATGNVFTDAGVSDPDSASLSYSIEAGNQPAQGVASVAANGDWSYTPVDVLSDYSANFTISVGDGQNTLDVPVSVAVTATNLAPSAASASFTIDEDSGEASATPVVTDEAGDSHTFAILTQPANGSASVVGGELRYTPDLNFNGGDSFTFRATDTGGGSVDGSATITVNPVNDPPTATAPAIVIDEDSEGRSTPVISDPDGDTDFTLSISSQPANGSASVDGNELVYLPPANFHGSASFGFTVSDGEASSTPKIISVTVNSVNDVPTVTSVVITLDEDGSARATPVISDDDPADGHTLSIATPPSKGSASVDGGELVYTPDPNENGPDSFTYVANDGTVDSAAATATITINSINDAPSASAPAIAIEEDNEGRSTPLVSDPDIGDVHSFAIASQPSHGVASVDGNQLVYVPHANYAGPDSFQFTVSDGTATSGQQTVSVSVTAVNDAPGVAAVTIRLNEDDSGRATPLIDDPDEGDSHTLSIASQPVHGSASVEDGEVVYVPNANYAGADSFTYIASDGALDSAPATATVTVEPLNDTPSASLSPLNLDEDAELRSTPQVVDPDEGDSYTLAIHSQPSHGSASVDGGDLIYQPHADFAGSDGFTFIVIDAAGAASAPIAVGATVNPVNDAPSSASAALSVAEDGAEVSATPAVADVDDTAHSFSILTQPENGSARAEGGQLFYVPDAGYHGADPFTFRATDAGGLSVDGTATVTVGPVNDAPVAGDVAIQLDEDSSGRASPSISDPDSASHTLRIVSQPANGVASVEGLELVYTPHADYTGADAFTFVASDGSADSAPASASVVVNPVNDAPSANPASIALAEDGEGRATPVIIDPDSGDSHTLSIAAQPANGTAGVEGGELVYTPNADFNGTDSFTFRVSDGLLQSAEISASVLVAAVNDAPQLAAGGVRSLLLAVDGQLDAPLQVSDVDSGDSHQFAVSGEVAALVNASTLDGKLRLVGVTAGEGILQVEVVDAAGARSAVLNLLLRVIAPSGDDVNGDGISDQQAEEIGLDPDSADSDGDGIADALEIGDPANPVDSDGDGVIDALESGDAASDGSSLAFVVNPATAAALGMPALAGETLQISAGGAAMTAHSNGNGLPLNDEAHVGSDDAGYEFPLGLLDFSVTLAAPGGSAEVVIRYPAAVAFPADAVVRKLNAAGNWATFEGAQIDADARTIRLLLQDGDAWDRDGEINGVIRDPVGLAKASSTEGGSSGGGGGGATGGLLLVLIAAWRRRRR